MANKAPMTNDKKKYDLGERSFRFSREVIALCSRVPKSRVNDPVVSQLVRSGTSIGANYAEADAANSKKDFINKIAISKKEVNETKYWIRVLAEMLPAEKGLLRKMFREVQELNLIFSAIIRKAKENGR